MELDLFFVPVFLINLEEIPAQSPELALCAWSETVNRKVSAAKFVNTLADHGLLLTQVASITRMIEGMKADSDMALAVEMIAGGAFSHTELKNPDRIAAYFARTDWQEIVARWKESPTIPIRALLRKKRKKKEVRPASVTTPPRQEVRAATAKPAPPPAPQRFEPISREETPLSIVKAALSGKLKGYGANALAALEELAENPTIEFTLESLARAVERRRRGAGAKCPPHTIRATLRKLAESNFVTVTEAGDFRHNPKRPF